MKKEKFYCIVYFNDKGVSKSWSDLNENQKVILEEVLNFLGVKYEVFSRFI